MSIRGLHRGAVPVGSATRSNVPVYVDSDDNKLKIIPAGSGSTEVEVVDASSTQTLTGKTVSGPAPTEVLTALDTLTAAESGKVIFLNSATEFAVTLPALAAGLRFTFIVKAAPSGADYTIVSPNANEIVGQVYSSDLNAASDGDFEATGCNTISFVSAKAVVGDSVELVCDGTLWYARAFCSVFDAITFTDV